MFSMDSFFDKFPQFVDRVAFVKIDVQGRRPVCSAA
jgi:hypothetical protein